MRRTDSPIETAVYGLIAGLHELAIQECKKENTSAVHFIVSEQRKLDTLIRALKMREIIT